MSFMGVIRLTCGFAGLSLAASVDAWPLSLNFVPIAEILGAREIDFRGGGGFQIQKGSASFGGMAIGVGDRFEVGFDDDLEGNRFGNLKTLVFQSERTSLAGGFLAFGSDEPTPYLTAMFDAGFGRFHTGALDDGARRWMLGFDTEVGEWCFMADVIGGVGGNSFLGAETTFGIEGLRVYGWLEFANGTLTTPSQHLFVGYSVRF